MRHSVEDGWPSDKKVIKVGTQNQNFFPQEFGGKNLACLLLFFEQRASFLTFEKSY